MSVWYYTRISHSNHFSGRGAGQLDERDLVPTTRDKPPKDVLNLLGAVFVRAVAQLVKRGFERGYIERQQEVVGIRGRLVVAPTIRRQLPLHGKAECCFADLEHDTLANRIIKATLTRLACSPAVNDELRHTAAALRRHFRDVADVQVAPALLHRVVVHRNNRHYGFSLHLCGQIFDMLLPDPGKGAHQFRDFARDHRAMARLFEKFVRSFYHHHRAGCGLRKVSAMRIDWASPDEISDIWPSMQTDICIERLSAPPLIVDTKFYQQVLKPSEYGRETLSSSNLYQLFTYVQNLRMQPGWQTTEGLLLYAENGGEIQDSRVICGARFSIATINLAQDWPGIEKRLRELIAP